MNIKKIENDKFKTNQVAMFLTIPITKENMTKNAILPKVLKRGTNNLKTQLEINKKLEDMYGAIISCGIEKTGNYCVMSFMAETLNDDYAYKRENLLQETIDLLIDIVFNPLIVDNGFKKEYVDQEKENIKKIIKSRTDDKAQYAYTRCIEELFKDEPYGVYKYGNIEELEKIDEKNLYHYYKKIISESAITFIIGGKDIDNVSIPKIDDKTLEVLEVSHKKADKERVIRESLDVNQGKLMIGLDIDSTNKYAVSVYNAILGGGANSKLFQNVREKSGLAYSVGSSYLRRNNVIIIKAGIELPNFQKTVDIIKKQIECIKKGEITDSEIKYSKELIIASIREIPEDQEALISYYFDQQLFNENKTVEEYIEKIKAVTIEEIKQVAEKININTIYYLCNDKID